MYLNNSYITYQHFMLWFYCYSGHPECPGRISAILNMFNAFQLTSRLLILQV